MRINVVFNVEGTDELQKLTEALCHVASVNEKAQLEQRLEELRSNVESLQRERRNLEKEVKRLKLVIDPEVEKLKIDTCKEESIVPSTSSSGAISRG